MVGCMYLQENYGTNKTYQHEGKQKMAIPFLCNTFSANNECSASGFEYIASAVYEQKLGCARVVAYINKSGKLYSLIFQAVEKMKALLSQY